MKIEAETRTGGYVGLSPKTYHIDMTGRFKRSTKGVPKHVDLTYQNFLDALYYNKQINASFNCLRYNSTLKTVCLMNQTKRALNSAFVKLTVLDSQVDIRPLKKDNKFI
jgi:hypothetical protein